MDFKRFMLDTTIKRGKWRFIFLFCEYPVFSIMLVWAG